ncbi:MAG TPA: hypothetical protein GXX19_03620 [Syntrophomonadaceae bacterium]|nr:hypothetical protein [Syntrophomonadaceae bacterium]
MPGNKKKAVEFLKTKACEAYLSGDVGAVRHLSAIALEKASQTTEREDLKLEDFIWAFVFMLNYLRSDWEFSQLLVKAYESFGYLQDSKMIDGVIIPRLKRPDSSTSPYAALLNFLFDVFQPPHNWQLIKEHKKSMANLDISLLLEGTSGEDCGACALENELLLSLIIEVLWYLEPQGEYWLSLCEKWIEQAEQADPSSSTSQAFSRIRDRLRVQRAILFPAEEESPLDLIEEVYSRGEVCHLLAKAWFYFYHERWQDLDRLIPVMVELIPFESEYFLYLQGLINMTRHQRSLIVQRDETEAGQHEYFDQTPGVMRYQRVQLSRPTAIFHFQRGVFFDGLLADARRKFACGYLRAHALRLLILLKLEALRTWDLGSYLDAMRRERDLSLQLGLYRDPKGEYSGDPKSLKNALLCAVKGLDANPRDFPELEDAEKVLETLPKADKLISDLVKDLISVPPAEWPSALSIFDLLGDAVPEELVEEVAKWSVKVYDALMSNRCYWNSKPLKFWEPIIEFHDISGRVWDELFPVFKDMAMKPFFWASNYELMWTVLVKAPLRQARDLARSIAMVAQESEERYGYVILFNASLVRADLKDICIDYLRKRIHTSSDALLEYDLSLLLDDEDNKQVKSNESACQSSIEKLEGFCKSIENREGKSFSIGVDIASEFRRVDWSNVPEGTLDGILERVATIIKDCPNILNIEVAELMKVLINICRTAPEGYWVKLVHLAVEWIKNPPRGKDIPGDGGPFGNFLFATNIQKPIDHALIVLVVELYIKADASLRREFRCWAVKQCISVEDFNLSHLCRLFIYILLTEEGDAKEQGYAGLMSVYARVYHATGFAYCLKGALSILDQENVEDGLSGWELLEKSPSRELVKEILFEWIKRTSKSPEPEERELCAVLVKRWTDKFGTPNELERAADNLRADPRARVRRIFTASKASSA